MKKMISKSLLGLFLLSSIFSLGFSQDAKGILDKMIQATGGRTAMEAIQDTTFSGTMDMIQMGMSGIITFFHKEPNKLRTDIEVMGLVITSAFDGELAWWVNPQTGMTEELPAEALVSAKNEALGFGNSWMLEPEKYGITLVDKGKETIEGKEYIVLEQVFESGDKSTYYIDPKTYLPYKLITTAYQMGVEVEQETVMTDYKKVSGLMIAHSLTIYQGGEEFGSMIVEEIKYNSGIEDSVFEMK